MARIRDDRNGFAVAEYGLIAAVVGIAIAVASLALGAAVTSDFAAAAPCTQANC